MSVTYRTSRTATNLPLALNVSRAGVGGVTGLSCRVSIRNAATASSYLDFADMTFRSSSWTQKESSLADIGNGTYQLASLNVSAITNLPAEPCNLLAEYRVLDASSLSTAIDVIQVDDAIDEIRADSNALAASITELLRIAKNKLVVNLTLQRLELYNDAGTVVIQHWPLLTNGGENVQTQFGMQTVRGAPAL